MSDHTALPARLRDRSEIGPPPDYAPELGPCWLWTGQVNSDGYGRLSGSYAHGLAYRELVGPIPAGLVIDHLCRVRHCVNVDHMEPVTSLENVLRGVGPIPANMVKTHCLRGHPFDAVNTWLSRDGRRYCRACRRLRDQARNAGLGIPTHVPSTAV